MKDLRILGAIFLGAVLFTACVKEEWVFDDNVVIDHLDPSFALPLVQTTLNIGKLEQSYDSESFIYNENEETFALVYPTDLFEFYAQDLIDLPSQNLVNEFNLETSEVTAFNLIPAGSSLSFPWDYSETLVTPNSESLDSIILNGGMLTINMSSSFEHDLQLELTIPSLVNNGVAYSTSIPLNYQGSTPVLNTQSLDLTGYVLDLTDGGITSNEIEIQTTITLTHSGASVDTADELSFEINLDLDSFQALYGYLGQITQIFDEDTQSIKLYDELNGGILHFEDPSIELFIDNSTGIPMEVDINTIFAPENTLAQLITGDDLENLPIIAGAVTPGETAMTTHTITNQGTNPPLSDLLDEGPLSLIYSVEGTTNPTGAQQNFILDTSKVSCRANVVLPIFGYADNFSFVDTLALDLEDELGLDDSDNDNFTADDISKLTLRLITDNGLPVDAGVQVYFLDSNNVVLDSLFTLNQTQYIMQSGLVNFSLSSSDPDFGRVTSPTRTITDIVMSSEKLNSLIDNHSMKAVLKSTGFTNSAATEQSVRFYPEYNFGMKLSAKIDMNINLSE